MKNCLYCNKKLKPIKKEWKNRCTHKKCLKEIELKRWIKDNIIDKKKTETID